MALVGNLKDLKLVNIIQINCIERNKAKLFIRSADKVGAIFFNDGSIVHAEFDPYVGVRAVHEMLSLNEGQFKVELGIESPTQTINQPWNSVVLEGLRLVDEQESLSTPIPKQLFANLSNIKNVENVFVLDFNGKVIEGKAQDSGFPLYITFLWYKQKKILNHFYSDEFQFVQLRQKDGYIFIFENRPNLIVIKTNLKVIIPEFKVTVRKILKQLNF
ncbi:MAG: DUF4388 domain-containing protein, partial [Nitrosopumilaceae archaeon]|nr:DUF4388 domain-containing protein [Nitrosopumilaceae archaeon]NIU88899.1 DUF4388 domain-containing protein [Nitrosopumilaceae archaeon]NIX63040.1 DUF4388 domain-containing protein [Nitrosopumilaceae archaeon]